MGWGTLTLLPQRTCRNVLPGCAQKSRNSSVTPKGSQGAAPLHKTASTVLPSCQGLVSVITCLIFHPREEVLPSLSTKCFQVQTEVFWYLCGSRLVAP